LAPLPSEESPKGDAGVTCKRVERSLLDGAASARIVRRAVFRERCDEARPRDVDAEELRRDAFDRFERASLGFAAHRWKRRRLTEADRTVGELDPHEDVRRDLLRARRDPE